MNHADHSQDASQMDAVRAARAAGVCAGCGGIVPNGKASIECVKETPHRRDREQTYAHTVRHDGCRGYNANSDTEWPAARTKLDQYYQGAAEERDRLVQRAFYFRDGLLVMARTKATDEGKTLIDVIDELLVSNIGTPRPAGAGRRRPRPLMESRPDEKEFLTLGQEISKSEAERIAGVCEGCGELVSVGEAIVQRVHPWEDDDEPVRVTVTYFRHFDCTGSFGSSWSHASGILMNAFKFNQPERDARRPQSVFRLPQGIFGLAEAKASIDGKSLSRALEEALNAYIAH